MQAEEVAQCGPRRFLTPAEVADQLAVSVATVQGWILRAELRAVLVSLSARSGKRRFRIDPVDLETFLTVRKAGAVPPPRPSQRCRSDYERIV